MWSLIYLTISSSRLDNGVISINLSHTFFTGIGHVLEYIDQVVGSYVKLYTLDDHLLVNIKTHTL